MDNYPTSIGLHIGKKIKKLRISKRKETAYIAEFLGIDEEIMTAIEHGTREITAPQLWDISMLLRTNINYFFPYE